MVSVLLTSWKGLGLPRQLPNPIDGPRVRPKITTSGPQARSLEAER